MPNIDLREKLFHTFTIEDGDTQIIILPNNDCVIRHSGTDGAGNASVNGDNVVVAHQNDDVVVMDGSDGEKLVLEPGDKIEFQGYGIKDPVAGQVQSKISGGLQLKNIGANDVQMQYIRGMLDVRGY